MPAIAKATQLTPSGAIGGRHGVEHQQRQAGQRGPPPGHRQGVDGQRDQSDAGDGEHLDAGGHPDRRGVLVDVGAAGRGQLAEVVDRSGGRDDAEQRLVVAVAPEQVEGQCGEAAERHRAARAPTAAGPPRSRRRRPGRRTPSAGTRSRSGRSGPGRWTAVMVANAAATGIRSEPLMTFIDSPETAMVRADADPCRPASCHRSGSESPARTRSTRQPDGPQQLARAVHLGRRHPGPAGRQVPGAGVQHDGDGRGRRRAGAGPAAGSPRGRGRPAPRRAVRHRRRGAAPRSRPAGWCWPRAAAPRARPAASPRSRCPRRSRRARRSRRWLRCRSAAARGSRAAPGGRRSRPRPRPPTRTTSRALAAVRDGPGVQQQRGARLCHGCSSRRTISSPSRAVDRQCTRRRSSPWRYSRVAASSSPALASDRARLSPLPVHSPASAHRRAACCDRRGHDEGVAWR